MINSPPHLSHRRERWLLITLAGVQFTNILDFMIMMPLGPQFTALFHITDAQFGWLVSAYTLAAGASGLLASTYIDRFDRKQLLLVLYLLFALATLGCGIASTYESLFVARVFAGIFGGVLSALTQTIVGDVIPFERRGAAMGVVMTSFAVATVAGVPLGLFVANHLGWNAAFLGIAALSFVFVAFAWFTLPRMRGHLNLQAPQSAWQRIAQTVADKNHQRGLLFSFLLMFTGFTVIPYITIYMQINVGIQTDQIPLIYLVGGVATLISARWIGSLADRYGKFETYRVMALTVLIPMAAVALMPRANLWLVLPFTTLFFVFMSGRNIPGMAMLTAAASPAVRGTFMTLSSAVQSAGMGLAALLGGQIISRDAQGLVQHYWVSAALGASASVLSICLASRLNLHQAKPITAAKNRPAP